MAGLRRSAIPFLLPASLPQGKWAYRGYSRPLLRMKNGQRTILLRLLMTNACSFNCHCCPMRHDRELLRGQRLHGIGKSPAAACCRRTSGQSASSFADGTRRFAARCSPLLRGPGHQFFSNVRTTSLRIRP